MRRRARNTVVSPALSAAGLASVDVATPSKWTRRNNRLKVAQGLLTTAKGKPMEGEVFAGFGDPLQLLFK